MDGGTNFAVASGADAVHLCLFDEAGTETRVALTEYDAGVWHGFVAGVGPGQAYGYRVTGPYEPARGMRCNPAKLLLDPYALAIDGEVRFGPEVLGYDVADPDRPSPLDSAGHVPRSLVVDPAFGWSDAPPAGTPTRTRSSTRSTSRASRPRTPTCPTALRGTYAGLAHEAALAHLTALGVTTVELLPVHHSVPEAFLPARGLTNYWGYNTIGFFAPHAGYSAAARAGRPARAGRRVPGDGGRPARRRPRGRARRGVQPHRRERPPRADAVPPRHRQRRLLPARSRRPQLATWTRPAAATR